MHGNRQYKPKKLKRLNDINDNDNSCNKKSVSIRDTYEFDHDHFCNTFMRSHYRPLQAVSTMLSHAPQQQVDGEGESYGFDLPLIKQFFNSISSKTKKNRNVIVDTATSDTNSLSQSKNNHKGSIESKCPLEQVSTTLSLGHHMRFKELLLEIEKDYGLHPNDNQRRKRAFHNKRSRQREFRKLCDLFREERCLYAKALNEFQVNNAKRFLTGFRISGPASEFAGINADFVKQWKDRWDDAVQRNVVSSSFGPCTQAISLLGTSQKSFDTIRSKLFEPKIVHRDIDGLPTINPRWLESMKQKQQLDAYITTELESKLLCDDDTARTLALEHNVDIVLTFKSLEALVSDPKTPSGRWTIPLSFVDIGDNCVNIPFMEDPLPSIKTPRECLSVGITEALIRSALDYDLVKHDRLKGKSAYTVIMIPSSNRNLKALIRYTNYCIDKEQNPVAIMTQLEYFPEKGFEQFNRYDRAKWLLTKCVQKDARIMIARVDANTAKVLNIEEKSVADALTINEINIPEKNLNSLGPFEESDEFSIDAPFNVLYKITAAISLLEKKTNRQYVVQRESDWNAICRSSCTFEDEIRRFDIDDEINKNGTSVLLNTDTLMSSFNMWGWNMKRLPYTFNIDK